MISGWQSEELHRPSPQWNNTIGEYYLQQQLTISRNYSKSIW